LNEKSLLELILKNNLDGFPIIKDEEIKYCNGTKINYLVMELLGKSLKEYLTER
jgi:hypothetical protein